MSIVAEPQTDNPGPSDPCIFCAIVAGQAPAEVVYEDEHTLAFLDVYPANRGHALVVSKRHARDIFDISEEEAMHVMCAVVRVARAVDEALQPDGLNLIQANRPAAMQTVPHFHVHVIPRWWDDGLKPIWRRQRAGADELREIRGGIAGALRVPGAAE